MWLIVASSALCSGGAAALAWLEGLRRRGAANGDSPPASSGEVPQPTEEPPSTSGRSNSAENSCRRGGRFLVSRRGRITLAAAAGAVLGLACSAILARRARWRAHAAGSER